MGDRNRRRADGFCCQSETLVFLVVGEAPLSLSQARDYTHTGETGPKKWGRGGCGSRVGRCGAAAAARPRREGKGKNDGKAARAGCAAPPQSSAPCLGLAGTTRKRKGVYVLWRLCLGGKKKRQGGGWLDFFCARRAVCLLSKNWVGSAAHRKRKCVSFQSAQKKGGGTLRRWIERGVEKKKGGQREERKKKILPHFFIHAGFVSCSPASSSVVSP